MPEIDIPREQLQDILGLPYIAGVTWIMDTASVRFHVIGEVPHARSAESEKGPDRPRKKQQRVPD